MGTNTPFLRGGESVFDPKDITAMSMALDDVCKELSLGDDQCGKGSHRRAHHRLSQGWRAQPDAPPRSSAP
jgi:hypothetical protein